MKKTIISAFVISVAMLSSAVMSGQTSSRVFSTVVTPELPEKVTLCGETIDLDRADKYEAFDRELTSIAYTHGSTDNQASQPLFPRTCPDTEGQRSA